MVKFFKNIIFISSISSYLFSFNNSIDIITTNDIHGFIDEQKASFINPNNPPIIIGGSGFIKYVNDLKEEIGSDSPLLLLDGGNFFQGSPIGISDSGRTIIQWMNRVGYDALVPGNYDFIFGVENLVELSKQSNFDFLGANLFYKDGDNVFKPYKIVKYKGISIGIIGLVNPNLENLVLPHNLDNLELKNPIEILKKNINELKDKVDMLILLTSSGVPWDRDIVYNDFIEKLNNKEYINYNTLNAIELGYYADGIDILISGGISKGYPTSWYDPNSHIYTFQNYGGGTSFGHIIAKYDGQSKLFYNYESAVSGQVSQTLFLNDFRFDEESFDWIKSKTSKIYNEYYKKTNWDLRVQPDGIDDFNNEEIILTDDWSIPNINKKGNLDIITWNCEFFPTANDSTIKALSEAISDFDADIIAFQEIKNRGWFGKLMELLPQYYYIISQQSSFMDQAIIYKKNDFNLVNRIEVFSENDYNFAGRPPLKADFINIDTNTKFSVINLHMKCCDSGLNRRKKAAEMLYEYVLDNIDINKNLIILGDWNDDLKDNEGEHCFEQFMNDDQFIFPTLDLTYDISKASYPKEPYVSFLDHILVSSSFLNDNQYFVNTLPIDEYMGSFEIYESYISDHMPVYLSFPY